jgi:hypothetical protein
MNGRNQVGMGGSSRAIDPQIEYHLSLAQMQFDALNLVLQGIIEMIRDEAAPHGQETELPATGPRSE